MNTPDPMNPGNLQSVVALADEAAQDEHASAEGTLTATGTAGP